MDGGTAEEKRWPGSEGCPAEWTGQIMSHGDKGLVEEELDRGPLSRDLSDGEIWGGSLGRGRQVQRQVGKDF